MLNMFAARILRRGTAVAILAGGLALSACHNALDVNNPRVIAEDQLGNAQLINTLLNSAVFAVQTNYDEFVWFSAIITDEALNATNDYRSGELSQRIVELAQGNVGPYPNLQFTRATADTSAALIRKLVTTQQGDLRLARALAYAGYGYVFLAEFTCTAPINGGPLVSDDSLEKVALARFNEAIADATPADTGATKLVADTILAFARVGAARASLNLNDKTSAANYASLVPASFVLWVDYILSGNLALENTLWTRVNGQNKQLGVHPLMQNLHDPRVRYVTKAVLGHNQLTLLNIPYSPRTFSSFTSTDSTPLQAGSKIELASGLEARYILAEAQGPNATTIALVNERRAFGGEQPLGPTDDVMAALREEKRRDFFLGARRLGDLRRYKAQGVGDFFPSGQHPTAQWGLYGSATCYIITQDEMNSNPNVTGYVPPSTRPPGYSP
jgi:hypothetical protein